MTIGTLRKVAKPMYVASLIVGSLLAVFFVVRGAPSPNTPQPQNSTTPTTIAEGQIFGDVYILATAITPQVVVYTQPPGGISPAGFTPTPAPDVSPIPRDGLSAAGAVTDPENGSYIFPNPTFFGNPAIFPVVKESKDWIEVRLPARPNGQTGWVKRNDVVLSRHDAQIDIDLTQRRMEVRVAGQPVVMTSITIGEERNPTPEGKFFITDTIPQPYASGPFGPYVLATSGYSEVLEKFDDGLPVVAIHGTNEPQLIGEPVSNGCIRVSNETISYLARILPPGVPVVIKS